MAMTNNNLAANSRRNKLISSIDVSLLAEKYFAVGAKIQQGILPLIVTLSQSKSIPTI